MRFTRSIPASDRRGFTMVELTVVLIISAILIGFAVPRLQAAFQQRDVTGARDGVLLMAARARARAMEQGRTVELRLRASDGVAEMVQGGTTIETFQFGPELGVEANSDVGNIVMCYGGRGFAVEPCSTSLSGAAQVEFTRAGYSAALEVWQLGQLRKL